MLNEVDKMDERKKDKEENWPLVVKLKLNKIIEETDKSALCFEILLAHFA